MKILIFVAILTIATSCCVTVNLIYTQGDASDVMDDNDKVELSVPLVSNGPSTPDRPAIAPAHGNGPSAPKTPQIKGANGPDRNVQPC